VENNGFVLPGHEGIYLRGLQSGFYVDWLGSMSLLIPQVEASIRNVLKKIGIPTISVGTDGIQEEIDINRLLDRDDVKEIFGEGGVFDLRAILIERFGYKMRNRSSHGLMSKERFTRKLQSIFGGCSPALLPRPWSWKSSGKTCDLGRTTSERC
jgi:hypothetical protein